jgi:hypothetical protein
LIGGISEDPNALSNNKFSVTNYRRVAAFGESTTHGPAKQCTCDPGWMRLAAETVFRYIN